MTSLLQHAIAIRSSMEYLNETSLATLLLWICFTFPKLTCSCCQTSHLQNAQHSCPVLPLFSAHHNISHEHVLNKYIPKQLSNSDLNPSMRMHAVTQKICHPMINKPLLSNCLIASWIARKCCALLNISIARKWHHWPCRRVTLEPEGPTNRRHWLKHARALEMLLLFHCPQPNTKAWSLSCASENMHRQLTQPYLRLSWGGGECHNYTNFVNCRALVFCGPPWALQSLCSGRNSGTQIASALDIMDRINVAICNCNQE